MNIGRDLVLMVTLAGAVTAPAMGQPAPSVTPPGPQSSASIPDLSGFWAHPYFPGVEPPPTGPGPVFNRRRRADGRSANLLVGDYNNPILKPAAAEVVKRLGDISLSGVTYPTPSNRCWPSGVPYIFFQPGTRMLQLPRRDHLPLPSGS